jgi:hypothetical protein
MWIVGIILTMVVMTGGAPTATLPTAPELEMMTPAADLAPTVKAFFGTWEGTGDGGLASRLVVEAIDATSARVVYAWADDPQGHFPGGWVRVTTQVLPEGALQWGSDEQFTFKMAEDHRSIEGARRKGGQMSRVTMQKIERE